MTTPSLDPILARLTKSSVHDDDLYEAALDLIDAWGFGENEGTPVIAALLDLVQRQDAHTSELEAELDALKAKLGERIQIMDHVWRCEVCGDLADPISVDWKWVGDRWEHSHGEPIGCCAARNLGPWRTLLSASIAHEKRLREASQNALLRLELIANRNDAPVDTAMKILEDALLKENP